MSHADPNRRQAVAQYRKRACAYDRRTRVLDRYRRPAVERLLLGSGDTVIDVACGTGANFALLEQYIGPTGRVVGVELMLRCRPSPRSEPGTPGGATSISSRPRGAARAVSGGTDAALSDPPRLP